MSSEVKLGPMARESRAYSPQARQAAFLLGGIGTGNVSIGSRGELRDWEIFNHPGKGVRLPNTHFAIRAEEDGEDPVAKILESRLVPPYNPSHGFHPVEAAGLPRLSSSEMRGEYPFAWVDFEDDDLPVSVQLEAFTPFVPLNPEDSGIPGAVFTYRVQNHSSHSVNVTIVGSLFNPIGGIGTDRFGNVSSRGLGGSVNEVRAADAFTGIDLKTTKQGPGDLLYGNMALVTTNSDTSVKRAWYRAAWYDELQEFWADFMEDGRLTDLGYDTPSDEGKSDTCSLAVHEHLEPGETRQFQFVLTWYFPNRLNGWGEEHRVRDEARQVTQNHYVNQFSSAWDAAAYLISNYDCLYKTSLDFHDALYSTTLPGYVLDALSSNITALRSTTCFWLSDGRFLAYEGCFDDWGCCDGTCTHVWNYAQTLAFLFPTLEQNMRRTEYLEEVEPDGKMNFRGVKMFDSTWNWGGHGAPAAVDGQMGTIMRAYREWRMTGDDAFLREIWPTLQRSLSFALPHWDLDGDFVFDGVQHNTYDIEFHGPNPLASVMFLGALRAAEEMATYLGFASTAGAYRAIYEKSRHNVDSLLWNGEYYEQRLDDIDAFKYQHGTGCLSDQLLGQQFAHLYGLGYLLPEEHVKKAIKSVFDHNFRHDLSNHHNLQRTYALNDEKGLLLCSWPKGGRPRFPFVYSDEVWTGIEYQVATHLIYEGFVDEALTMVQATRDRYDGIKRNPWNEIECGNHYARSMSGWGLLIAFTGYKVDVPNNRISFNPALNRENFSTLWTTGRAWGKYSQVYDSGTGEWTVDIQVLYGDASGLTVFACGKEVGLP